MKSKESPVADGLLSSKVNISKEVSNSMLATGTSHGSYTKFNNIDQDNIENASSKNSF